ncbi:ureidoglycolate lyase [Dasania marina]|uniref:ureidoglycolate lyase n=1 Tax=Dasania marina TaxID=471499 RepID=UPI0030D9A7A2|tara:strand:- start:9781 stop:10284 length:504 start_codon:yes stop_codon:yes gene_type:complete
MRDIKIRLQPLTREAFAPYGDVIEVNENNNIMAINYGKTERHHDLANIDVNDQGGKPIVNIFNSQPVSLPFTIKVMERHPLGSQAFINMGKQPYVVVVGKAGEFDIDNLQGFIAQEHQGVNYHKGTWHHYSLCLNEVSQFLVIDRGGEGHNCDEEAIPENINLIIES